MQSRTKRKSHLHPIRITIIAIIIVFLAIWAALAIANHPKNQAEQTTISIAKAKANLKHPGDFFTYNREKTYYTIAGENSKNQKIFVITSSKGKVIQVLKQKKGITKNDALTQIWNKRNPKKVLKIALGVFKNEPVWEVSYVNKQGHLCYELLDFKTGKDLQKIVNI
ncbi:hypothetical protein FC70_GL001679 [Paucilactobacillus oligofermentans DSM 15707 = LMG 22743]|uniref:Cell wall elongation regulator TseB-like domain-containing protein n=1 Tax=Paucilactobacillus oligofermentans DSM 15707 = LMG 22743 TaxID=1423778 RepID=A0A0R1RCU9_9LACO|nr:DUF5590 domain-containing protein [Paucilactobacillus oligofermentans]KRL54877.1 hypothetical protein FC70_GL001679 [Paucilactobacillus oligofermentans DSM 15707 = LMG 22743]